MQVKELAASPSCLCCRHDDADQADMPVQLRGGVHRVVYPRNFGRVSEKDAQLRAGQLRHAPPYNDLCLKRYAALSASDTRH